MYCNIVICIWQSLFLSCLYALHIYWHYKGFNSRQNKITKNKDIAQQTQLIYKQFLQGHTMLPFTLSKICQTLTAGTHPSLTMAIVPVTTVWWNQLVDKCVQQKQIAGEFFSDLHRSSGSWPPWTQRLHLNVRRTEHPGSCVPGDCGGREKSRRELERKSCNHQVIQRRRSSPDDHVVVGAVWLSAGIRWCNRQGTCDVTKVASHRVVRHADHDAVPGADAVVSRSYSCKQGPNLGAQVKWNKPVKTNLASLTESEQPVSFADDAADASWVHVPHELPE